MKTNLRKNNDYSGSSADVLFNHIPLAQIGWGPVSIGAQGLSANLVGNREVGGFLNINRFGDGKPKRILVSWSWFKISQISPSYGPRY